jgi:hypothetical protein
VERARPSPDRAMRDLSSPARGEEKQTRSRGAVRTRVLQQERKPRMFRLEIKREAERRKAQTKSAAPHEQMSPPARASGAARATDDPLARTARFGRARLSALHRGARQAVTPDSTSGRASWNHRVQTGGPSPMPVQRAPRGPVIVPDGTMPEAARARFARPPAGTALAPLSGSHLESALAERDGGALSRDGDEGQARSAN